MKAGSSFPDDACPTIDSWVHTWSRCPPPAQKPKRERFVVKALNRLSRRAAMNKKYSEAGRNIATVRKQRRIRSVPLSKALSRKTSKNKIGPQNKIKYAFFAVVLPLRTMYHPISKMMEKPKEGKTYSI